MTPEPFVSARSRGRVAIVLIVAGQVVQFFLGVLGVMFGATEDTMVPIYFLAFIPGAFGFLTWLQRAYRNLPALHATELRYTPGWAVGSWFIPLVNLFAPHQVVSELWKASDPSTSNAT